MNAAQQTPAPLTVDTECLSDLFLPAFHEDAAAVAEMTRLVRRAKVGSTMFRARVRALVHTESALEHTVEMIRKRGGLLLLGGAAIPKAARSYA